MAFGFGITSAKTGAYSGEGYLDPRYRGKSKIMRRAIMDEDRMKKAARAKAKAEEPKVVASAPSAPRKFSWED